MATTLYKTSWKDRTIYIYSDRWFDARTASYQILCTGGYDTPVDEVSEGELKGLTLSDVELYEVSWTGNAVRSASDLKMRIRKVRVVDGQVQFVDAEPSPEGGEPVEASTARGEAVLQHVERPKKRKHQKPNLQTDGMGGGSISEVGAGLGGGTGEAGVEGGDSSR